MEKRLKRIDPGKININVFRLIEDDWFLLTAGNLKNWNTMTAGWGGFGYLWERPVAFGFVRPQRHTFLFTERFGHFTFSFFDRKYKKALQYCGSHSGRDGDKAKETGLVPAATKLGNVYFQQARLALECRKIYWQDIDPSHFLDLGLGKIYPKHDYHRMYVGEIIGCLARQ
ncbi:MAG: flavin reductase family protein [Candidatus Edwardsbacteria bacterium]|nr:flavin reductase family protein [Candidatus Edwardsbacteria bacterium]